MIMPIQLTQLPYRLELSQPTHFSAVVNQRHRAITMDAPSNPIRIFFGFVPYVWKREWLSFLPFSTRDFTKSARELHKLVRNFQTEPAGCPFLDKLEVDTARSRLRRRKRARPDHEQLFSIQLNFLSFFSFLSPCAQVICSFLFDAARTSTEGIGALSTGAFSVMLPVFPSRLLRQTGERRVCKTLDEIQSQSIGHLSDFVFLGNTRDHSITTGWFDWKILSQLWARPQQ